MAVHGDGERGRSLPRRRRLFDISLPGVASTAPDDTTSGKPRSQASGTPTTTSGERGGRPPARAEAGGAGRRRAGEANSRARLLQCTGTSRSSSGRGPRGAPGTHGRARMLRTTSGERRRRGTDSRSWIPGLERPSSCGQRGRQLSYEKRSRRPGKRARLWSTR